MPREGHHKGGHEHGHGLDEGADLLGAAILDQVRIVGHGGRHRARRARVEEGDVLADEWLDKVLTKGPGGADAPDAKAYCEDIHQHEAADEEVQQAQRILRQRLIPSGCGAFAGTEAVKLVHGRAEHQCHQRQRGSRRDGGDEADEAKEVVQRLQVAPMHAEEGA